MFISATAQLSSPLGGESVAHQSVLRPPAYNGEHQRKGQRVRAPVLNGVAAQVCCAVSASSGGSVLVTSASSSVASRFYRDGACTTQVGTGSGNFCIVGGQFTGAYWFNGRRRSLLGDAGSIKCDSAMKPTGVVYTEDASQGHWMLTCSSDAAELFSQMQNVTDAEKVNWLMARGATYVLL